jgi:vacuolar-type H+-ATPase subunit I/STV1
MKIVRAVIELFTDYSPERETRRKLTEARLTLVDHECNREYYSASVPMLKERITRLEAELRDADDKARRVHTHIQAPAPAQTFHPAFNFRRAAR